jgi:Fe-S cluster biosynthesis and repair protein YggX
MGLFSSEKFKCARCALNNEPIGYAPVPTELGKKIGQETCAACWKEWLQKQNQLINHFGLDVSNPDTHEFLFDQMRIFFFDEGVQLTRIDESQEGTVKW